MIRELLENKSPKEKANIKGVEIVKAVKKKKYVFDQLTKTWK